MSLPFYSISCTGCEYTGTFGFNVAFRYEGGAPAEPTLSQGWCATCDGLRTICVPYSVKEGERELIELRNWRERQLGGLLRKVGFPLSASRRRAVAALDESITRVTDRMRYFESVTFPGRCMTCGSTDVERLTLPSTMNITSVVHVCGGRIRIQCQGRMSFGELPTVVFATDGTITRDERTQG